MAGGVARSDECGRSSDALDIPHGHQPCDECFADPETYLRECEVVCPRCDGAGHHVEIDTGDPKDVWDPRIAYLFGDH